LAQHAMPPVGLDRPVGAILPEAREVHDAKVRVNVRPRVRCWLAPVVPSSPGPAARDEVAGEDAFAVLLVNAAPSHLSRLSPWQRENAEACVPSHVRASVRILTKHTTLTSETAERVAKPNRICHVPKLRWMLPAHFPFNFAHTRGCQLTLGVPAHTRGASSHAGCQLTLGVPAHARGASSHAGCQLTRGVPAHTRGASSHSRRVHQNQD
jgi:hypothetical protein